MTAPSLSNFTAELRSRNISKPSLYYVEIIPPGLEQSDNKLVSMWCSSAHTPQVDILTNDSYLEDGVRRKYAYDQEFQNLVLTFYVDQDFLVKKFFDDWKDMIVMQRRKFSYPDDYTADKLNLFIINSEGADTFKYEYSRVFPKTIQSIALSYESGVAVSVLSVEFVYEDVYGVAINAKSGTEETSKPEQDINSRNDTDGITNNEMLQNLLNRQTLII